MSNIYADGSYWKENPTFHEEDQDFKFKNIVSVLDSGIGSSGPTSIVDIGCGSGRLAFLLSRNYDVEVLGIDLNPENIEHANRKYEGKKLSYRVLTVEHAPMSYLAIVADVFEHVNDYYAFIESVAKKYNYIVFNIPLDLSVVGILNNSPIKTRKKVRHVHYFYGSMILAILNEYGLDVKNYKYVNNRRYALESSKISLVKRLLYRLSLCLSFLLGDKLAALMFGGYSLTVLCHSRNIGNPA